MLYPFVYIKYMHKYNFICLDLMHANTPECALRLISIINDHVMLNYKKCHVDGLSVTLSLTLILEF